jgi:hypothetical protein
MSYTNPAERASSSTLHTVPRYIYCQVTDATPTSDG